MFRRLDASLRGNQLRRRNAARAVAPLGAGAASDVVSVSDT